MSQRVLLEVGGLVRTPSDVTLGPAYILWNQSTIEESGAGGYQGNRANLKIVSKPNHVAMPGFVNTHGHAAMTLFRGIADDVPFESWLKKIHRMEKQLTREAVYWGTLLACWEMASSGTTCFADMYMHMDEAARAVSDSGLRGVLSVGMHGFDKQTQDRSLSEARFFWEQWNGAADGRIQVTLGPHSLYSSTPAFLSQVAQMSHVLGIPVQIHLSETRDEVRKSYRRYGMSPVRALLLCGLLERPLLAAHCVHVDGQDIALLAEYHVHVAHNPQSNLKLATGVAPVVEMLQAGITVGLGTDSAASSNNLDMFEELRLAATLHKGVRRETAAVPAAQAFAMATAQGAKAVFRPEADGTLEPGAAADVVLLNLDSPRFTPTYQLLSKIAYAASAEDVTDVFVAGREVIQNKQPVTLDVEQIRWNVTRIVSRFQRT